MRLAVRADAAVSGEWEIGRLDLAAHLSRVGYQLVNRAPSQWHLRQVTGEIGTTLYGFTEEPQHASDVEVANPSPRHTRRTGPPASRCSTTRSSPLP